MTCEEIFLKLTNHMLEGIMMHEQFVPYYEFLGLPGYARCHKKHYELESEAYMHICKYYIKTYNKLLPVNKFTQPQIIPTSWLQYTRQEVDAKTKQSAVKEGLEYWVEWEKTTYELYQDIYKELFNLDKIADCKEIDLLISDVKEEVCKAEQYHLEKISTNYNMTDIIEEQKKKDRVI